MAKLIYYKTAKSTKQTINKYMVYKTIIKFSVMMKLVLVKFYKMYFVGYIDSGTCFQRQIYPLPMVCVWSFTTYKLLRKNYANEGICPSWQNLYCTARPFKLRGFDLSSNWISFPRDYPVDQYGRFLLTVWPVHIHITILNLRFQHRTTILVVKNGFFAHYCHIIINLSYPVRVSHM